MIPELKYKHKQTTPYNCVQACVASILGLPLSEVPDFYVEAPEPADFWELFEQFLASKGFYALLDAKKDQRMQLEVLYLASGTSPRGLKHMTIYYDGKLVHDPHESNEGIQRVESAYILIPFDPSRHTT